MSEWYRLNKDMSVTKLAPLQYPDKEDEAIKRQTQLTTYLQDGFWVSTVFLGLDHSWGGGPPLLWESMVFNKNDDKMHEYDCQRYPSYKLATLGHAKLVTKIKQGNYIRRIDNGEPTK